MLWGLSPDSLRGDPGHCWILFSSGSGNRFLVPGEPGFGEPGFGEIGFGEVRARGTRLREFRKPRFRSYGVVATEGSGRISGRISGRFRKVLVQFALVVEAMEKPGEVPVHLVGQASRRFQKVLGSSGAVGPVCGS